MPGAGFDRATFAKNIYPDLQNPIATMVKLRDFGWNGLCVIAERACDLFTDDTESRESNKTAGSSARTTQKNAHSNTGMGVFLTQ